MKAINKQKARKYARNYTLLTLGSLLLAFGDAAFLVPLNLVTGGVLSIGIIVQHFVGDAFQVVDIVTWGVQLLLLIVSFIFLGKRFTIRTLFSTLLYPLLFTLLYRVPFGSAGTIGQIFSAQLVTNPENYALTLMSGIFGGACIGVGVGLTYNADGSTGGLDVLSVIIAKCTPVKESLSAFLMDASLVVAGIIIMRDIPHGLIGVLSALVCALGVQYIYVKGCSYVVADVISEKYEEIMAYVHKEMDHATTLIPVTGGFTGEKRTILRVAMPKKQMMEFKNFVALVDPNSFITYSDAGMIHGEGFKPLVGTEIPAIEKMKKKGKNEKDAPRE